MSFEEPVAEEKAVTVFVAEEFVSSEEPSLREWSSLVVEIPEINKKKVLYDQGLYYPGSGEICTKTISISDSGVFRHVYYNYPAILDPGINQALFKPDQLIVYSDDGHELYLHICKEMRQAPVSKFARGLFKEEINLKYYCVDPKGVRPMAIALTYNKVVKGFSLSYNFLTDDGCYHLGEMLMSNSTLRILDLSGCRIKPSGLLRLLEGLTINTSLKTLNLNRNELGDDGAKYLAKALFQGLDIQNMYLSYNNIGSKGARAFSEAFDENTKFVELDLSWNNLVEPESTYSLLAKLGESKALESINLSWNGLTGLRIGTAIKLIMRAPNLRYLNASNNRLAGEAITKLVENLAIAKKLVTLDLSFNPMSPADAFTILTKIKSRTVKVQNVLLENISVTTEFLELLKEINQIKSKKNFVITYGSVIATFKAVSTDPRELILNRADFLTKRVKKHSVDIALVVLQLVKNNILSMNATDFTTVIKESKAPLDEDLIDEMVKIFAKSARNAKDKMINVQMLADYITRKWPERKLPPTPPPKPEHVNFEVPEVAP